MHKEKEFNIANDPKTNPKILQEFAKNQDERIRAAVASNPNAYQKTLLSLVGDECNNVSSNLLKNKTKFDGSNFEVQYCKHTKLRLIKETDAEFVLSLRFNSTLNKYLSTSDNNINRQLEWTRQYKIRERSRLEFYFIITSLVGKPLGTVRLFDFKKESFCWGSWIIEKNVSNFSAIESALSVYEMAFYLFSFSSSHFVVRKQNEKVIKFHKGFGAKIISEDKDSFYFNFSKKDYEKTKPRYKKFFLA